MATTADRHEQTDQELVMVLGPKGGRQALSHPRVEEASIPNP